MVQPLLVSISALTLATETVRSILKIDDVVRLNIPDCGLNFIFNCTKSIYVFPKSECTLFHVKSENVFCVVTGQHPIRDLSLSIEFCPLSLLVLRGIRGLCRRQSVQISTVVVTLRNLIKKRLVFLLTLQLLPV